MSRTLGRGPSVGLPWLLGLALIGCVDASDVAPDGAVTDVGGLDGAMQPPDGDPGGPDGRVPDGAAADMAQPDMAQLDMALPDMARLDMAPTDGGGHDMRRPDMQPIDLGPVDAAAPDAAPPPDCPTLPLDDGGSVGPCHVCRAPGALPPGFHGWTALHVDPAAPDGGDGSLDAPLNDLAGAAFRAGPRTVFTLAPGQYAGPVGLDGPMALVGTCADEVRITAPAEQASVIFGGGGTIVLDGITVAGAATAVNLEGAASAEIRRSVLRGEAYGLSATDVPTVALSDSRVEGAGRAHISVRESGLAVTRSVVGPGAGVGIQAEGAGDGPPCADAASPVCPYRHAIFVIDSHITGVTGFGVDSRGGRMQLRHSLIEGVEQGGGGGEPVGIRARQSFLVVRGSAIRRVAAAAVDDALGLGLWARSSRAHVEDTAIEQCGRGGVQIDRLPPGELVPFAEGGFEPPADWFPGEVWSPLPDAFAGDGFDAPVDWFPGEVWAPQPDALPFQLRPETEAAFQSPELGLFRWARAELRDVRVGEQPLVGVDLSGHAVRVRGGRISGIEAGPALAVNQRSLAPLDGPGAEVVALSELRDLEIGDTGGAGIQVADVALVCGPGGDAAAPCSVPPLDGAPVPRGVRPEAVDLGHHLTFRGLNIRETRGLGMSLVSSVATLERNRFEGVQGIGVWSFGSRLTMSGNEIRDIRFHNLQGRFAAVDVADGVIIEPSRWPLSQRAVVRDNSIISARRVGLLLVNDVIGLSLDLALGEGRLEGNGLDVVMLGNDRNLQGVDVDVQNRDEDEIPPPSLPQPQ